MPEVIRDYYEQLYTIIGQTEKKAKLPRNIQTFMAESKRNTIESLSR